MLSVPSYYIIVSHRVYYMYNHSAAVVRNTFNFPACICNNRFKGLTTPKKEQTDVVSWRGSSQGGGAAPRRGYFFLTRASISFRANFFAAVRTRRARVVHVRTRQRDEASSTRQRERMHKHEARVQASRLCSTLKRERRGLPIVGSPVHSRSTKLITWLTLVSEKIQRR